MAFKKSVKETNSEPSYEVLEKLGTLSVNKQGWSTELRYISWNGREPKYDIRPWLEDDDGEKMRKGITLTGEELEKLCQILKEIEAD